MDLSNFYTVGRSGQVATGQTGNGLNVGASGFDLLLQGLMQGDLTQLAGTNLQGQTGTTGSLSSITNRPLFTQDLAAQFSKDLTNQTLLTVDGNSINTDLNNAEISHLLLLDGSNFGSDTGLLERLTKTINDLQAKNGATNILFNLTPEQMAQLQTDLAALQKKDGKLPDGMDGFGFVLVQLTPATQNNPITSNTSPGENASAGGLLVGQQIKGAQQNLNSNNGNQDQNGETKGSSVNDLMAARGMDTFDELLNISTKADKFSALLKNAAAMNKQIGEQGTTTAAAPTPAQASAAQNAAIVASPIGALSGWPFGDGSLLSSLGWNDDALNAMGVTGQSYQVTGLQELTNVMTQARAATQPHPGTSLVAASFAKIAGNPDTKMMTLQLNPPDLGRVEVRMEFGKDRSLKATVIAEKPEAHLMLQRDAQVLERALQNLGMGGEGSSLSFQLADDGQNFGQNGRHDGSRNKAFSGGTEDNLDVIESTMNWRVDPDTGHMHYNILA